MVKPKVLKPNEAAVKKKESAHENNDSVVISSRSSGKKKKDKKEDLEKIHPILPEVPDEKKKPEDIIKEFPAESPNEEIRQQEAETAPLSPEKTVEKDKSEEMPVPEPKGEPIVELKRTAFHPDYTLSVKIYANGKIEYNKHSVESGFNDDKEFSVRPEETKFYADKLVEIGFLNFRKNYMQENFTQEGFYDNISLNYNGNKKTVSCSDKEQGLEKYYALSSELASLNFSNVRKKIKINFTRKKIIAIVAAFAVLLFVAFIILSIQPKSVNEINTPRYITHTSLINETQPISIAEFAGISKPGYEENVSVLVMLRREEVHVRNDITNIYQYIADDYNNKILVSINGVQKSSAYGPLFSANSNQTFRVTGILKNTYKGMLLEVRTIVPEERELSFKEIAVTETIAELKNVTVPAKIRFSLGISRIRNIFS